MHMPRTATSNLSAGAEETAGTTNANIEFEYLYRDAANYKFSGSVIFAGSDTGLRMDDARRRIRGCLLDAENFVADQLYLDDLFPVGQYEFPTEDDHCYHEFYGLSATAAAPTDPFSRTIDDLVRQVERIGPGGWRVFDPADKADA